MLENYYYILDEAGNPVSTDDLHACERLLRDAEARTVAKTYIAEPTFRAEVSTVFLCINHAWYYDGDPVLWETMIFSDCEELEGYQERYTNRKDAEAGHRRAVHHIRVCLYRHELPEIAASLHMKSVILWSNGMVMVFSDEGEQMPEYQGYFERVAPLINAVFRGAWEYGNWNAGIL